MESQSNLIQNRLLEGNINLSFWDSLLIIVLALLAGLLSRFLYLRFGNSFSSKASYSNTLLMVTVCVACLIAVVKSSLALSLGLVGALSVVRFRTAVKEPYTLSFILFSVCMGIAIGASQYIFAFLVSLVGIVIALFVNKESIQIKGEASTSDVDTLNITATNEKYLFDALKIASSSFNTYSVKTISTSNDVECLATIGINIRSNEDLTSIIKKLSNSPGILNVTFYNSPI